MEWLYHQSLLRVPGAWDFGGATGGIRAQGSEALGSAGSGSGLG